MQSITIVQAYWRQRMQKGLLCVLEQSVDNAVSCILRERRLCQVNLKDRDCHQQVQVRL